MRRTSVKGVSFDTVKLEGPVFTAEMAEKALVGSAPKETDADYHIPRGLRLLDEIGRSFQIAQAQWKSFEADKLSAGRFIKEFFIDALAYTPGLFEKLVNIDPLESAAAWYVICNARHLRLVRKSSSLARPSYLEFNLETILRESRFPEYQMLYRVMHASRATGLDHDGNSGCVWDIWKKAGEELGVRVREGLRRGVTRALDVLGNGFLNYNAPGNDGLRSRFESGELSAHAYYQELMRLMYRFLFIITIEERDLAFAHDFNQLEGEVSPSLQPPAASSAAPSAGDTPATPPSLFRKAQELYRKGYSLRRLRDRSARYAAGDTYGDLWEGIKIVFRLLGGEGTAEHNPLDLPVLGGLFKADQCPHLDACGLSNAALLEAMYLLRWTVEGRVRTLIDYKNMGSEELGSVYESLLEMVPQVDVHRRSFVLLGIDGAGSSAGNTRKTSGSYYTSGSLVDCLIKSNLEPLIDEKLAENNDLRDEQKILSITVIDPACGSGHFLLAAARKLADRLAFLRANGEQPIDPDVYRNSLRDVIASCVYGVDLNPMAVELARMALWLEGHEPGKPLSFLDHHIRYGNSLIGVMEFDALAAGIPDDAYRALSGDDKKKTVFFRKRNGKEKTSPDASMEHTLFEKPVKNAEASLAIFRRQLEKMKNDSLEDVEHKHNFLIICGKAEIISI